MDVHGTGKDVDVREVDERPQAVVDETAATEMREVEATAPAL